MAILKFEPPKERAFLRVKIARDVQERVERYRAFCGALELADLIERALVYVFDKDADFRARRRRAPPFQRRAHNGWSVTWVSPADKSGGAP